MRFPSLRALAERASQVVRLFPLTLALAALATVIAVIAADSANQEALWRVAMVALLGVPLSIGVTLASRYRGWRREAEPALQLAGLLLLGAFYLSWPGPRHDADVARYLQFSAVLHLGVAVLPFIRGRESSAFWQFNRRLFESLLRATLFAGVLFVGLAIALGAVDRLLGVHVPPRSYLRLFLTLAFLVHPWIFLAGVPASPDSLELDEYPRALKIFTQYVLTPLVAVYLVIVGLYLAKIVITGTWPSGWTGYLVASVAVAGVLGFLLVHPLRSLPGEGWIRLYSRALFIGLIPASVMLLLALWQRVAQYGLTEPRTLGLILGLWLLAIAGLFTFAHESGIRTIPLSLAAVLAVSVAGPFGVRRLSVRSQEHRLERLLAAEPGFENRAREASAALTFLLERRAVGAVRQALGDSAVAGIADTLTSTERDSLASRLLAERGIRYTRNFEASRLGYRRARRDERQPVTLAGAEWMVPVASGRDTTPVALRDDTLHLVMDSARRVLTARLASGPQARFPLDSVVRAIPDGENPPVPGADLTLAATAGTRALRLVLEGVTGHVSGDTVQVYGWNGVLLIGPAH